MAKVAVEVGSTANSYQVLAKLAAGGMAEIFLARSASGAKVERYCVLKRVLREHAGDAQFVRMFLDEARLAAQLQHPNIASVYDVGMLGESYFFTMEYVHGETVRSILQRAREHRRPLPVSCVLTIIAGGAAGLHHAHERNANDGQPLGIVHRDVSPSNLMVSFEGNTKLVDFGVAKAANRSVETKSGMVKGKISYLSPEQCRGQRVDRRSDLFSLGIVMWEMLTGRRLYRRNSDFDNMTAIVQEPTPRPTLLRPDIPPAVEAIVLRLLSKTVGERFQSAAEVLEAVEDASLTAGVVLSTSAVRRLMHDLYGVRAEPWLELDDRNKAGESMTLSARAASGATDQVPENPVERDLASLLDLSGMFVVDEVEADADDDGESGAEASGTGDLPEALVSAVPTVKLYSAAKLIPPKPIPPSRAPPPPAAEVASDLATGTGSLPLPLVEARSAPAPVAATPAPRAPSRRTSPARLVLVVLAAAALGVAGAWYLADRGSSRSLGDVAEVSVPVVADAAIDAARGQPLAVMQDGAIPDATADATVEPIPDAAVIAPDAPPDVALAVVTPGPPSAPAPALPPRDASPSAAPPIATPAPALAPSFDDLIAAYHQGRYAEVVHTCQGASVTDNVARPCTLAACKIHNAAEAERWLAIVPAKDSVGLVQFCKSAGTAVGPALDCLKNPMDCR